MKRLLWLGVGLAIGGLVVRAAAKKAQTYTPRGIAGAARESAGGMVASVRSFVDDVRDGMAEREQQIHEAVLAGMAIDDFADEHNEHGRHNEHDEYGRHGGPGGLRNGRDEFPDEQDQEGIR